MPRVSGPDDVGFRDYAAGILLRGVSHEHLAPVTVTVASWSPPPRPPPPPPSYAEAVDWEGVGMGSRFGVLSLWRLSLRSLLR